MNRDERQNHEWLSEEPAAAADHRTAYGPGLATTPIERLLVATDLSEGADLAVARAAWLPLAASAQIRLVHALAQGDDDQVEARAREALGKAADALAAERTRAGGPPLAVRHEVLRGDPFGAVSHATLEDGSQLVVVGRHGRRGITRHFLGSTAEQIVRKVGLPVLVVHERPVGPYRKPLVATAFEVGVDRVLVTLFRLAGAAADQVAMVHAIEEFPAGGLLVAGASPAKERKYYEDREAQAASAAAAIARRVRALGEKLHLVVRVGVAARVVLEEAMDRESDLIAVGTRARSGLPRLFLGTTAGTVLREAPCDVLVVPL